MPAHLVNNESRNPAIEEAMKALYDAVEMAERDPMRPVYHFRPPAQWMNDINGPLYYKEHYHIFYQHNPYADTWGQVHWGHARSENLVTWEHLPIALWPSVELGEAHCFSGTAAINGDGFPILIYTSVAPEESGREKRPREEWAAIGDDDMLVWRKVADNPVILHRDKHGKVFSSQDPFIFVDSGRTFMLTTTFREMHENQGLHIYEATDTTLLSWIYRGPFFDKNSPCPNFFKVDDNWILLMPGPGRIAKYYIGQFDIDHYRFESEHESISAYTPLGNQHVMNVLLDAERRPIVLGWITRRIDYDQPGRGWAGCMSLPRIATIGPNQTLCQHPHPALETLREKHHGLAPVFGEHDSLLLDFVRSDTLEIKVDFEYTDESIFGLIVRQSDDGKRGVTIQFKNHVITISGTGEGVAEIPVELEKNGNKLSLHIFLDKAVLEMFINGGQKYSSAFMHVDPEDLGVGLFAHQGKVHTSSLDIWELSPI